MDHIISLMLIVASAIHFIPLSGVLGAKRLSALYGMRFDDPSLVILMRHRAVLFGLVGALLAFAAFDPVSQPLALVGGFVSVISFLWIAHAERPYSVAVRRIVIGDLVALACLILGASLSAISR